jgi:hypothetical protein
MMAILSAPKYLLFEFALPLLEAIFSDVVLTAIAIGAAALGYATTWVWGVATFFLLYALVRSLSLCSYSIAEAVGYVGNAHHEIARSQEHLGWLGQLARLGERSDA